MIDDSAVNCPLRMAHNDFNRLAVSAARKVRAGLFASRSRDPFTRFISAQALEEGPTVVTRDPAFAAFGCKVLW